MTPLVKPLTITEIKEKNYKISVVLAIPLHELIDLDAEGLNDYCEEKILSADTGDDAWGYLSDISYTVVGYIAGKDGDSGSVLIQVDAQVE